MSVSDNIQEGSTKDNLEGNSGGSIYLAVNDVDSSG